mmetsp:Transcript_5850/g.16391  ORF Transcript_5850/g.16391 Transcript_5850/m.16391 type:complete len:160 (-) Transcript_5850:474-953(-)
MEVPADEPRQSQAHAFWSSWQASIAQFCHAQTLSTTVLGETLGRMVTRDHMIAADLAHIEEWHGKMGQELEKEARDLRGALRETQDELRREAAAAAQQRTRARSLEEARGRHEAEQRLLRRALAEARAEAKRGAARLAELELETASVGTFALTLPQSRI